MIVSDQNNSIIIEYKKSTKVSENSQKNKSETVTNEYDKEMPKEIPKQRYISPEEDQELLII